jgi:histone arginine demethylase JMJD6
MVESSATYPVTPGEHVLSSKGQCGRHLKESGMHKDKFQIERRKNLSYEDFAREYLYALKPVIVTDVLQKWPAMKRWTPEFFGKEFAATRFRINEGEYGQTNFDTDEATEYTMAEFIGLVQKSTDEKPAPYFRNKILYEIFPSLRDDIEPLPEYLYPNWLSENYLVKRVSKVLNRGAAVELFIGGKGAAFPVLHYDGAANHAFLMQIYGRKEYIVYPPEQEPFLYPAPHKVNHSLINSLEKPDLKRFPLFANALPTTFFLEPGELLFVPSHWWHTAKIVSPSITISVNVLNQSNWQELINHVSRQQRNVFVSVASRIYLSGAGAWRSWRDREWRRRLERPAVR